MLIKRLPVTPSLNEISRVTVYEGEERKPLLSFESISRIPLTDRRTN